MLQKLLTTFNTDIKISIIVFYYILLNLFSVTFYQKQVIIFQNL